MKGNALNLSANMFSDLNDLFIC